MKRAGYVLSPTGVPLVAEPVSVKNNATGVVVATSATNAAGRWDADLADEAQAYKVEIGGAGGATQRVVQAPASIELEWLFVRYGMKVVGGPVELPASTTIGGVSVTPGNYVELTGDTMSGGLEIVTTQNALVTTRELTVGSHRIMRRSRGTLAAPADSAAFDLIGIDGVEARVNNAWQLIGRQTWPLANVAAAKGAGTWSLQLADVAGNLVERIGANGFAGTVYLTGATTVTGALDVMAAVMSRANQPVVGWYDLNEADVDERWWEAHVDAKNWSLRLRTEAGGAGGDVIQAVRGTGTALSQFRMWGAGSAFATFDWPTRSLTLTGPLYQGSAGNYAYLGSAVGTPYPRTGADMAVGWNFTGGSRDITLWNTDINNTTGATISFALRQLLAGSTRRDLMTVWADGRTNIHSENVTTPQFGIAAAGGTFRAGLHYNGTYAGLAVSTTYMAGTTPNAYGAAPATGNRKLAVFNQSGAVIGYLPLYT